ncbi:MAG: acetate/propionate family kinase [Candidatus Azambacteria bacterium]|nr:acetate/propionate family kinase [Candidatus Azambacteria bacterium]
MEKKYLVVNLGSASKKYALYEGDTELFFAHYEKEGNDIIVTEGKNGERIKSIITQKDYETSAVRLIDLLIASTCIHTPNDIAAIGFRVVASGEYFNTTKLIDDTYREKLAQEYDIAPLHVAAVSKGIEEVYSLFPETPFVAISDSAFHAELPDYARTYALPIEASKKLSLYRYGYHGISIRSVLDTIKEITDDAPSRVIVCHLGGGASVTAVKDGKSIDTSMGLTPLEGLVMATRAGDIDSGALIYLAKSLKLSLEELDEYLNHQCGLLGLSGGKESGVRELIELEKAGDENAKLALAVFVYRIKKYIGAYTAALGGVDMLVFTATIGERSSIIRARVCEGLACVGVKIDELKNNLITGDTSDFIDDGKLSARVAVIRTNEMAQILKDMTAFLGS